MHIYICPGKGLQVYTTKCHNGFLCVGFQVIWLFSFCPLLFLFSLSSDHLSVVKFK